MKSTNISFLKFFFLFIFSSLSLFAVLPENVKGLPLDISLKNPVYKGGLITTDEGGIIQGKNLFIQALHIAYSKKDGQEQLKAWGELLIEIQGRTYRADEVTIDFTKRVIEASNGVTKDGDWYVSGEKIVCTFEGDGTFHNVVMSTSENEQDDWSFWSKETTLYSSDKVVAKPVVFYFEKLPLFYLPSLSKSLKDSNDLHLRYRVRNKGTTGLLMGVSCVIHETDTWNHRALVDYNFPEGLGAGLHSEYDSHDDTKTTFRCLNYVAQSKNGISDWEKTRYRLQGSFSTFWESPNIHVDGMYDKLSDRKMQQTFKEHRVKGCVGGMTQLTLTKPEDSYIARLNSRVRINSWQTVREELPLFTINQRPLEVSKSGILFDEKFSTGHLRFVYPRPNFRNNFSATRTELDQRITRPFSFSHVGITPWIGYRGVHYDRSPKGGAVVQAIGMGGGRLNTHLVATTATTTQTIEPYLDLYMSTSPRRSSDKNYIFDLQDSFARVCYYRPGVEHVTFFQPNTYGFQQSLFSEFYGTFFFNTPHLSSNKPRLHLQETWNMTEKAALKGAVEYDMRHRSFTFGSLLMKYTFTKKLAGTAEVRTQDKWYFRKIDKDNYDVESFRSPHKLLSTQLSDPRTVYILGLLWTLNPETSFGYTVTQGFRNRDIRRYLLQELSCDFLVRGSLRFHLSLYTKTGKTYGATKEIGFNFRIDLGQQKGHTTMPFSKIGQGSYDIW